MPVESMTASAVANRSLTAASLPDIERQVAALENAISVLAGRPPGAVTRGKTLEEQTLPPSIPVGVPATLLERRPDVVAAEQLLVAANADVGAIPRIAGAIEHAAVPDQDVKLLRRLC